MPNIKAFGPLATMMRNMCSVWDGALRQWKEIPPNLQELLKHRRSTSRTDLRRTSSNSR